MKKIMQLIVEPVNYDHAIKCINDGIDVILVGHETYASRIAYSFSLEQIKQLTENKHNTKIWIKMNAFFFEQDLISLEQYLKDISLLAIDMVVFQDYAIAQLNHSNNLKLKLHYNPETLVTSYGQFEFFKNHDINGCFLARELLLSETLEIAENKQDLQLEIQGFGYGMIMHSRWKLITNFEDFYQTNIRANDTKVVIRENLRKVPNIIFEDNHGTHMLTGYVIAIFKVLDKLYSSIDFISLNFLYIEPNLVDSISQLFKNALNDLMHNNYHSEQYIKQLQVLLPETLISAGFLGGPKDILHMLKDDANE